MKQALFILFLALLASTLYAEPTYLVRSVFRSLNSTEDDGLSGSSQAMFHYSERCQQIAPNLLTIGQDSTEGNTTPGSGTTADFIARAFRKIKAAKQDDDPIAATNFCSKSPISVFAFLKSGSGSQQCNSTECTFFSPSASDNTIGGFWLHSGEEDAMDDDNFRSSSMVSITTYIANQTFAATNQIMGQQSTSLDEDDSNLDHNQTALPLPVGWNQTPGSIEYCPGTQLLTSVFAFQSGKCVVSPLMGMSSSGVSDDSLPTTFSFSQQSLENSWSVFTKYQAFYASCSNGGMVIQGCTDTSCQNCWLVSDNNGCVANWMHENAESSSTASQQMEKYYINFQGCGLGRARVDSNSGTTTQ